MADLDPDDFAALRTRWRRSGGRSRWATSFSVSASVFKFAFDNGLIDRPVRYGQAFKRPTRKVVRIDRAKKGPKLFSRRRNPPPARTRPASSDEGDDPAGDQRRLRQRRLRHTCRNPPWTWNGRDRLPASEDGNPAALPALAGNHRGDPRRHWRSGPTPKDEADAGLVFITKYGLPWAKDSTDQTLAKEFGKLLRRAAHQRADGTRVLHAAPHVPNRGRRGEGPAGRRLHHGARGAPTWPQSYRETISDARLKAVADYVRDVAVRQPSGRESRRAGDPTHEPGGAVGCNCPLAW